MATMESITGTVSRRGFIGRCAAAPVAIAAAGGIAGAAGAADLRIFEGRYAIDGHRIVDGYFASPKGKANLDVVLIVPAAGRTAAAQAVARSYAADGYLAIAPDLAASYRGAIGRPAKVAALLRDVPRLRRLVRGSGKVAVVTA